MDAIPSELLKYGRKTVVPLHKFIAKILKSKSVSTDGIESILVLPFKKGNKIEFNNFRGMSLLPTDYKNF